MSFYTVCSLFFIFSFTAFVRELTVNDNNANDTNLSCHIRITMLLLYKHKLFSPCAQLSSMGAFFTIFTSENRVFSYHFSFRPNYYYSLLPFHSAYFASLCLPVSRLRVAIVILCYLILSLWSFVVSICLFVYLFRSLEMPFTKCECTARKEREKDNEGKKSQTEL